MGLRRTTVIVVRKSAVSVLASLNAVLVIGKKTRSWVVIVFARGTLTFREFSKRQKESPT
jgi:hypothetical protein